MTFIVEVTVIGFDDSERDGLLVSKSRCLYKIAVLRGTAESACKRATAGLCCGFNGREMRILSDESSFVNATDFVVDGGLTKAYVTAEGPAAEAPSNLGE